MPFTTSDMEFSTTKPPEESSFVLLQRIQKHGRSQSTSQDQRSSSTSPKHRRTCNHHSQTTPKNQRTSPASPKRSDAQELKIPYLLSLPAELRNMIYTHALSTTSPLIYSPPPPHGGAKGIFYEENPDLPHQVSPLRRNIPYRDPTTTTTTITPFNALQSVNHQLRHETQNLELTLPTNNQKFLQINSRQSPVTTQLLTLASTLPPQTLNNLTRITIQPLATPAPRTMSFHTALNTAIQAWKELADVFAPQHAHLAIRYIFPSFHSSGPEYTDAGSFIYLGTQIAMKLRGQDLSYLLAGCGFGAWEGQGRVPEAGELERRMSGFRVVPVEREVGWRWIRGAVREIGGNGSGGFGGGFGFGGGGQGREREREREREKMMLGMWILKAAEWVEMGI